MAGLPEEARQSLAAGIPFPKRLARPADYAQLALDIVERFAYPAAVTAVIVTGAMHFDPQRAFDFPPGAFNFSLGFFLGLGAASRVGIYDYLGYYDVCYIGDEVRDPGRVIPRSILISTIAVAAVYIGINLSVIGIVPWREFGNTHGRDERQVVVRHGWRPIAEGCRPEADDKVIALG